MLRNLLPAIAEMSPSCERASDHVGDLVSGSPAKQRFVNHEYRAPPDVVAPGMPAQFSLCAQQKLDWHCRGCYVSGKSALLIWAALLHILCCQPYRETGIAIKDRTRYLACEELNPPGVLPRMLRNFIPAIAEMDANRESPSYDVGDLVSGSPAKQRVVNQEHTASADDAVRGMPGQSLCAH
jgi:hypothetical protein